MHEQLKRLITLAPRLPDEGKAVYRRELGELLTDPALDVSDDSNFSGAFAAALALGVSPRIQAKFVGASERSIRAWIVKAPPGLYFRSRITYVHCLGDALCA